MVISYTRSRRVRVLVHIHRYKGFYAIRLYNRTSPLYFYYLVPFPTSSHRVRFQDSPGPANIHQIFLHYLFRGLVYVSPWIKVSAVPQVEVAPAYGAKDALCVRSRMRLERTTGKASGAMC